MRTVHFDGDGLTTECPLDCLTFECETCPYNRGVTGFQVSCDFPNFPVDEVEQLMTDRKPDESLDI